MNPHEISKARREFIEAFERRQSILAECCSTEWYNIEEDGSYRLVAQQRASEPIRFAVFEKLTALNKSHGKSSQG